MTDIITVSPFRCRMWVEHERLEDHITEESCKAEIASFQKHGQLLPVLGRPLTHDPDFDYELIFGARRLFVARHLNVPLLVEVKDLSDKSAVIAVDIENRQRKDLSAYERALSYSNWLRMGFFSTQEEIAHALRISPSQISRLLKMSKLPSVIVNAFENPLDLCEGWGLDLYEAWQQPDTQKSVAKVARSIARELPRPTASKIYERLMSGSARGRNEKTPVHDQVLKSSDGKSLFRVRYHRRDVAFIVPAALLTEKRLKEIREFITEVLQRAILQVAVTSHDSVSNVTDLH